METGGILQEIAPLGENDLMYVADRHKACCDFPLQSAFTFLLVRE